MITVWIVASWLKSEYQTQKELDVLDSVQVCYQVYTTEYKANQALERVIKNNTCVGEVTSVEIPDVKRLDKLTNKLL